MARHHHRNLDSASAVQKVRDLLRQSSITTTKEVMLGCRNLDQHLAAAGGFAEYRGLHSNLDTVDRRQFDVTAVDLAAKDRCQKLNIARSNHDLEAIGESHGSSLIGSTASALHCRRQAHLPRHCRRASAAISAYCDSVEPNQDTQHQVVCNIDTPFPNT